MVHVTSCRFLRLDCTEDDHPLFRREYARTNRQRDVKLLRCFPHCCPKHIQRSYCGCSVHLLVTFSTDATSIPLDDLVVCARFEPSRVAPLWPAGLGAESSNNDEDNGRDNERRLEPGESVWLPSIVRSPSVDQREEQEGFLWIRAERESEVKQQAFPKNCVLYVVNSYRSPKWLYGYDSSITRTHREMTHHLVAYVFSATSSANDQQQPDELQFFQAVVLARHASPGFLLVSYRRSGASSNPGCELPAVHRPTDNAGSASLPKTFVSMDDLISASRIGLEQQQRQPQVYRSLPAQSSILRLPEVTHAHSSLESRESAADDASIHSGNESMMDPFAEDEDVHLWLYEAYAREQGFHEKVQQIFVLWRLFERLSLSDLGLRSDEVCAHVKAHWLRAATALRDSASRSELSSTVMAFLLSIFDTRNPSAHERHESAIVQAVTYLLVRAISSRSVHQLVHSAITEVLETRSSRQVRVRFVRLVADLYEILGDILRENQGSSSLRHQPRGDSSSRELLPGLVDDVLSLAYGHTQFRDLRPSISALLLGHNQTADSLPASLSRVSQVFMTQVRDVANIRMTRLRPNNGQHPAAGVALQHMWGYRWLLTPGSLQIGDSLAAVRLVDIVQLLHEFGCVDITVVEDDAPSFSLRSAVSFCATSRDTGMQLTVDGRLREFRSLPSGLSALIKVFGEWSVGDYAAKFSTDQQAISVDFVAVSEGVDESNETEVVRRLSLLLSLDEESREGDSDTRDLFLVVRGTICEATHDPRGAVRLSEMTSNDRAGVYLDLEWTTLQDVHAGYIAISTTQMAT